MISTERRRRVASVAITAGVVVLAIVAVTVLVRGTSRGRERGAAHAQPVESTTVAPPQGSVAPQNPTQAVTLTFEQWLDGSQPEASLAVIEDAAQIAPALKEAEKTLPGVSSYRGHVNSVHLTSPTSAEVNYSILAGGALLRVNLTGIAVLVDGKWLVSRETVCTLLAANGITCPQDPYVPQSSG